MLRKFILGFLISNFLLFNCNPMTQLQTNLGQLKDSLNELKTKLSSLQSKLEDLDEILADQPYGEQCIAKKEITIVKYEKQPINYEIWQFPALRNYVRKNCKNPIGTKAAFNVIERTNKDKLPPELKDYADSNKNFEGKCSEGDYYTKYSVDMAMKDHKFKGAVFQLASNDRVDCWFWGGSHANFVRLHTNLGQSSDQDVFNDVVNTLNTTKPSSNNIRNIRIAIHSGVQVVDTDINGTNLGDVSNQIVNVVLTAAYSRPKTGIDDQRAKNCLKAGYDGIMLSAIKLGVSKVVLTIIGGHVFLGNPDFTFAAIEQAVKKYAVKYNLNVTLYLDDAQINGGETQQLMDERFKTLRREINGGDYNIEPQNNPTK